MRHPVQFSCFVVEAFHILSRNHCSTALGVHFFEQLGAMQLVSATKGPAATAAPAAMHEILVEYFRRKFSHILQDIFVIFVEIVCSKD